MQSSMLGTTTGLFFLSSGDKYFTSGNQYMAQPQYNRKKLESQKARLSLDKWNILNQTINCNHQNTGSASNLPGLGLISTLIRMEPAF